jgi:hypothetical protein
MANCVDKNVIAPGITRTFIIHQRDPTKVRSYNIILVNPQVPYDQQGEIVKVFHRLKGQGNGDFEAHVTMQCDVVSAVAPIGFSIAYELWEEES